MKSFIDALDPFPSAWSENEKARVAIWGILSFLLLMLLGFGIWNITLYGELGQLKYDNKTQTALIDTLLIKQNAEDSVRAYDRNVWWKQQREDSIRRVKWDNRFKKEGIKFGLP